MIVLMKDINVVITLEDVIEMLDKEYPDKQPMKELRAYEQGKLVGCRMVIEHMKRSAE